jgi:hypothetical protein
MLALRCRSIALLLLVLHLAACATWRPATSAPRALIEEERPASLRITRPDSTTVVVRNPSIINDSITTVTEFCRAPLMGQPRDCRRTTTTVLSIDDVSALEVRRLSALRTAGFVICTAGAAFVIFYAVLFEPVAILSGP